jgi:hypothetical protein
MRCRWIPFAPLVGLVAAVVGSAQPTPQPKDGKLVLPLAVSPAAVPVPALKYTLLPELRDTQTGNQIPAFYKCFMEQRHFYGDKGEIEKREKWSTAPLADLAGEKDLVGYGGSGLRQADYAARLDRVDWAVLNQLKAEGINLLLPDVQQMRQLAAALKVRMRGESARKDYAAAVRTAQTMLALAHSFNSHPTLIGQLVGFAITTITLGVVEEMIQQPDAPNLFWALADLPAPFIDLRTGMQGERAWLAKPYDAFRKADPIPEAELNRMVKELGTWLAFEEGQKRKFPVPAEWFAKRANDPATLGAAKERLVKLGHKPAAVDKLSPLQVVMTEDFARYEEYRDNLMKWTNIPYWQIPAGAVPGKQPEGIFVELAPAGLKVMQAQARVQQHIGMLQAVEAVRAYAAANGGTLPASLEATKLPVPMDPVTGKPFAYEVKDGTAVIRGTPPSDRKADPYFNRVYVVTVRK